MYANLISCIVVGFIGLGFGLMGYRLMMTGVTANPGQDGTSRFASLLPGGVLSVFAMVIVGIVLYHVIWDNPTAPRVFLQMPPKADGQVVLGEVVLETWPPVIGIVWKSGQVPAGVYADGDDSQDSGPAPAESADKRNVMPGGPSPGQDDTAGLSSPRAPSLLSPR